MRTAPPTGLKQPVPLAPGGAKRLRAFLRLLGGNLNNGDKVGSPVTRTRFRVLPLQKGLKT